MPFFEATGAALARLTTQVTAIALSVYALHKEIKIQLDKETMWKSALASAAFIPFLLALELTTKTKLSTTQTLTIEILTAAGVYALSLYILKTLKAQDFELLKQALPKPHQNT